MKISKSKQELARIISENGGWRDGAEFSSQDKCGGVFHYTSKPTIRAGCVVWDLHGCMGCGEFAAETLPNWHQTILSRAEYFHLYPALGELCGKVTEENRHEQVWTNPPSIEHLAADYHAKLAIATQAQEEADSHRCGAEVALSKLEIAAKELGFKIEQITAKQDPELVITDWRDLNVGDEIEVFDFDDPDDGNPRKAELMSGVCVVMRTGDCVRIELKSNLPKEGIYWNAQGIDKCKFRFIRRP